MKSLYILAAMAISAATSCFAQQSGVESFLQKYINGGIVVFRQDYQLVDEEENEIRNAPGKEYWDRVYSVGARIGESYFLAGIDAARPWNKSGLSKNGRMQPMISATAYRSINSTEFEPVDFDASDLNEIRQGRIFLSTGSEENGFSMYAPDGATRGYAVWVSTGKPIETDDLQQLQTTLTPMKITFHEETAIYELPEQPEGNIIGGLFVIPLSPRPGLIDLSVAGHLQKIGGIWKLVSIEDPSQANVATSNRATILDDMADSMNDFIAEIGF